MKRPDPWFTHRMGKKNEHRHRTQTRAWACAATVGAFILLASCTSTPEPVPPLDGRAVFDSYVGRSVAYTWERDDESGRVTISGNTTTESRLRLAATGSDAGAEVEREPYESDGRTVYGFFGRTSGVAHLLFALHLPATAEVGDTWTADRIYGANTATYELTGTTSIALPDGSSVQAYRIEMTIVGERDDLRGTGYVLVSQSEGIVELVYDVAGGGSLRVERAGNGPAPGDVTLQVVPDSGYDSGYAWLVQFIAPAPDLAGGMLTIRPYLDGEEMTGTGKHYRPGERVYDMPFQIARFGAPLEEQEFAGRPLTIVIHVESDENRHPDGNEPAWLIDGVRYRELRLGPVTAHPLRAPFERPGSGAAPGRGGSTGQRSPAPGEPASLFQVSPRGSRVPIDTDIHVALRATVDLQSAVESFEIDPAVDSEIYLRPFTSPEDTIITVDLADLQPNTTYRVRVKAGLVIDGSPTTEAWEFSFETGTDRAFPPPELAGQPVIIAPDHMPGTLNFRLEWEPVAAATRYEVQETGGVAFDDVDRAFTTEQTSLDISTDRSNEFYYRVRGVDANGRATDWSRIHFVGAGK